MSTIVAAVVARQISGIVHHRGNKPSVHKHMSRRDLQHSWHRTCGTAGRPVAKRHTHIFFFTALRYAHTHHAGQGLQGRRAGRRKRDCRMPHALHLGQPATLLPRPTTPPPVAGLLSPPLTHSACAIKPAPRTQGCGTGHDSERKHTLLCTANMHMKGFMGRGCTACSTMAPAPLISHHCLALNFSRLAPTIRLVDISQ